MFTSFLIEVAGAPVGVAVLRDEGHYRFYASDRRVFELDGSAFDHPGRAELAARRLVVRQHPARRSAKRTKA